MSATQTTATEQMLLSEPSSVVLSPPKPDAPGSEAISLGSLDTRGRRLGASTPPIDAEPGTPDGAQVFRIHERWHTPRKNAWKLFCVFFSFINFGMNDACYGALLPSLEPYYHINYTVVSLIFLAPFAGYTASAVLSNPLHERFGRRGIAIFAVAPRLIAYVIIAVHPPFPVVVCILLLAGFGNGLLDAGWNAWVGNLAQANELLGFMHGFYGLGATISPLIISALVNRYHLAWYTFFYIMIALLVAEQACVLHAFWEDTGAAFRESNRQAAEAAGRSEEKGSARAALKTRVTWICSAFLLAYVGTEVSLGGWIIEFMIRVRHGQPFNSGLTATGFWLGITVGRMTLGFVTPRLGEKVAVSAYLLFGIGMQLILWLVPQFVVSAVAVSLLGFFMGPLFPASVIACTKILPQRLHVAAIGVSAAVGGSGASVLPFAVGAIAQRAGVKTLQPIILALLVVLLGIWLTLPKIPRHAHAD